MIHLGSLVPSFAQIILLADNSARHSAARATAVGEFVSEKKHSAESYLYHPLQLSREPGVVKWHLVDTRPNVF